MDVSIVFMPDILPMWQCAASAHLCCEWAMFDPKRSFVAPMRATRPKEQWWRAKGRPGPRSQRHPLWMLAAGSGRAGEACGFGGKDSPCWS